MDRERTEYRFTLDRRARLGSHLHAWGRLALALSASVLLAVALIVVAQAPWWAWLAPVALALVCRGFFVGLVLIALRPRQSVFLAIEERGVGFGETAPDFWVFADGILSFSKSAPDHWTLTHHNGTVLTIPAAVLAESDVRFLAEKAAPRTR